MKDNFDTCLTLVLKSEGGYVNNPADPGGRTNLGVTQATWEAYTGEPSSEAEMRSLTPAMVAPLYKQKYWDVVCGDTLPAGVDYAVFDYAVNSGTSRAAKALQMSVNAKPDGVIGPNTLAQVNTANPSDIISDVCERRLRFLQSLGTFSTFGNGWTKRVKQVESDALDMC
jgi:lysozyme family protein